MLFRSETKEEKTEKKEEKVISKSEQKLLVKELKEEKQKEVETKKSKETISINKKASILDWSGVMKNISEKKEMRIFVNLVQAKTQILGDIVEIKINKKLTELDIEYLNEDENIDKIRDAIEEETGKQYNIELIYKEED